MKNAMRGVLAVLSVGAIGLLVGACSSEESESGAGGAAAGGDLIAAGTPCGGDSECTGLGTCITDDTFTSLTGGDVAEFPGGYCSKLLCTADAGAEACGEGGYCFRLEQYVGQQLTACLHTCETDADCRADYVCHDGASADHVPPYVALKNKACLTESLLCVLGIVRPSCPDAGKCDELGYTCECKEDTDARDVCVIARASDNAACKTELAKNPCP